MKSLLQNLKEVDYLISQLQKLASRIRAGENVDAWRECNGLIAFADRRKQELIKESEDLDVK
jgi:hypothetical protein